MDWFNAHRKLIIVAITAVLAVFLDDQTAQEVAGAIGVVLAWLIPNDEAAVAALYPPGAVLPRPRRDR